MLVESIKSGRKHHSSHTEMIAHEQEMRAFFSSQRKHAGSAVKELFLMAETGVPNGT